MSLLLAGLVGIVIGVLGTVGPYLMMNPRRRPRAEEYGSCSHTIYALRVTVDTHDFGEDYQPQNMRWRWTIYQANLNREQHPHPLMLGNAASQAKADQAAHLWIDRQTLGYAAKPLPVVIPL